jgi:hypothetical protein
MMPTKIRIRFFFILFSGFLAVLPACKDVAIPGDNSSTVKTPVTITTVVFNTVTLVFDLPAASVFMNKSIIRASTAGTIENILVRQGEFAPSGQLLFTIKTREGGALRNMAGNDSTFSFKGIVNIIAIESGIINSIYYQKGDFVQEGDQIAVMSEQKSLVFIMDVPFEYQSIADKNKECSIFLPDNKTIRGTITGKLPEMEMQSQTVSYIIKPFSDNQLPANLIARISLIKSSNNNAQVVPKEAVLSNEAQTDFWVMKLINDTTAVRVNIKKGYENNDEIEITEPGFQESDRIVLKGNYGLADTAGIAIIR